MRISPFSWLNYQSLRNKGILMISVPLVFQVAIMLAYGFLADHSYELILQQQHYREALGRINWLSAVIVSASLSSVSHSLTHQPWYAAICTNSIEKADEQLGVLRKLMKDEPAEFEVLKKLNRDWQELK